MSFWQKLRESLFGLIGMTGYEYPGVGRDVVLSVPMAFALLILIVYAVGPTEASQKVTLAAINRRQGSVDLRASQKRVPWGDRSCLR